MKAQSVRTEPVFGVGQVLSKCRPALTKILDKRGASLNGARFEVLSLGVKSIVLRVTGADWSLVIKAFNPENPDAQTLLTREHRILDALNAWPLTPNLVASLEKQLLLIIEDIDGVTLDQYLTKQNVVGVARHIGAWYSVFNNALPRSTHQGNWAEYLARYDDLFTADELEHNHALLNRLKINNLGLSRNDAVPQNFIRATNGNLIGLDFAAAAIKPVGWDLLITARLLTRQFPDQAGAIALALARGWSGLIDGNSTEDFADLIEFFAVSTMHRMPSFIDGPLQKYRENYGAAARANPDLPDVRHVFRFHVIDAELQAVEQDWIDDLEAALMIYAEDACATPTRAIGAQTIDENTPSPLLSRMCALCEGGCCRRGKANHAYITADTLHRVRSDVPNISAEQLVETYVAHVPNMHVKDSCLFHTDTGCALPRDLRSDMCNSYVCRFGQILNNSAQTLQENPGAVLLVGQQDGHVRLAEVHHEGRITPVSPDQLDTPAG